MSELPDRPDLDQLRYQARELLRAATNGEPRAVTRLHAVSDRMALSAAQLAIAREYGYRSWPALKAEVERRRGLSGSAASPPSLGGDKRGSPAAPEERWSFGGATAIETSAGVLSPEALVVGTDHAALYASLMPSWDRPRAAARPRRLPAPGRPFARWARRRRARATVAAIRAVARFDDVTVVDDRGASYALRAEGMSGSQGQPGEPARLMSVQFRLDPVPGREVTWLELRGQDGAATRLLPSARPALRLGQLTPTAMSPAERELSDRALGLIQLRLSEKAGTLEDVLRQQCSAALARTAEIKRSGELDPASPLPDQLARLCAVLTGHRQAGRLPASWSGMLNAAQRADGPRRHLDIGAALPPIDGVTVQVDSLISGPDSWRLYLRATPGWWNRSEDGHREWNPVSVQAEDDLGGTYLNNFDGGTGPWPRGYFDGGTGPWPRGYEELGLRFLPRLDPLARTLKLTFRGAGQEIPVDLHLEPAASSQRE